MKTLTIIYITLLVVGVGGFLWVNDYINQRVSDFKHSQWVLAENPPYIPQSNDFMRLGTYDEVDHVNEHVDHVSDHVEVSSDTDVLQQAEDITNYQDTVRAESINNY